MLLKQINLKEALRLAGNGMEIKVLVPSAPDEKWEDLMPDTLQKLLDGCIFFRPEPAAVNEDFENALPRPLREQLEDLPAAPVNKPPDVWVAVNRQMQGSKHG